MENIDYIKKAKGILKKYIRWRNLEVVKDTKGYKFVDVYCNDNVFDDRRVLMEVSLAVYYNSDKDDTILRYDISVDGYYEYIDDSSIKPIYTKVPNYLLDKAKEMVAEDKEMRNWITTVGQELK